MSRSSLGKCFETGSWDLVAGHEALGEIFGAFQLCSGFGRSEDLQAAGAEHINNAGRKRGFRANHRKMDRVLFCEISQRVNVSDC